MGSLSLLQGNLPNPGLKPRSPTLQVDSIPAEPQGKPQVLGDTAEKPPAHCLFVNWDGLLVDTMPFSKSNLRPNSPNRLCCRFLDTVVLC